MEEEDNDVWTDNGECTICRTKTESAEEKEEHRKSKNHLKKYKVHSFFRDDISMFQTPNVPSELLERYKLRKTPVVGLQQCIEIQQLSYMEQNKSNFWACSICYVAGDSFETADIHLRSMNHVRNYLIEEEESQAESIDSYTDECDKYEMYQSAAISNFEKNGGIEGLQPPDILRMDRKSVFIREKLGIPEEIDDKMTFQPCDQENKSILNCSTCYEVFPINTTGKKHTIEKARGEHCEHPNHRRCSEIKGIIQEFDPEEKMIEYRTTERQSDLHWQKTDLGYMLSQPCGIRYVLSAGDDKMCMLCCSIVGSSTVDHCSGEFHAMKYLNLIHSNNSYLAHQLLGDERRQKIIDILRQAMDLGNDTRIVCRYLSRLPDSLKQQLAPEMLAYPEPPQIVNTDYQETTGKIFVLCHSCTTYIEFDVNSVDTPGKMSVAWLKHVKSAEHFDAAAMKARIHFYPEMFVPYPPTIRMDDAHQKGTWNLTKDIPVQTQCDVGLEFMVEDENDNEVICRCCWQVFNRNLHGLVTQHIRSYDHLKQYMFHQAPDSASFLLGPESDQKKRDFALDWLQKNNGSFPKRMAVYSKSKALELANWSPVKQRMVQTALSVPDSDKDVYETVLELVDKVAADGAETPLVTAREALVAAQMLITNTTRGLEKEIQSVICRCLDCDQLLIVNSATWQRDVFTNHVGSDEHHRRAAVFKQNLMSDFGFLDVMSTNNVKPFVQTDPNKKCIWQWNSTTKKHDYVASTVGVDDIIERRYPDPNGEEAVDFLCVLCAKIFPKRAIALQSHVREIGHCINWIHKHRDKQIRELTAHLEGSDTAEKSKELRKYLTTILKDVDKSQDYCIRVYDPYGKEREIQNEIVLKIQAQEKLKKSVEAKAKREAEQQKAADERKEYLKQQIEENVRRQNMKLKQKAEEEKARKLKEEERKERLRYAREQLAAKERTVSREDMELQKRLQSANQIQDKMQGLRNIDIRQAKLEAERIRLASRMPVQMVPPPRSVHDPQLVIMPQLVSKNVTLAEQMLIPNCPPPVFPPFPQHGMHMNPHNPYAIPPPPQNTGRPGFSMSFPPKIADSPAVQKRPSLRGQRVDPTIHDISRIKHKADLLTYMRGAQATEILNAELPRDFMRSIQDNENAFGMTYVAEVICLDEPELDSYICMICDHWASPRGMVRHLCDKEHKQKFLFKNFPDYHTQYVREKNPEVRRIVFKNIISDLKRKNKGNEMSLRMNTLIDKATIERLWPGYEDHFYAAAPKDQWTSSSFQQVSGPSVSVPNAVPLITLSDNSDEEKETRSRRDRRDRRDRSRSSSRDRLRRSRSRSRDRRRRRSSRSRSRSRSRDRDHRSDRDRSDRDRDRDRHRRDRRERSRSRSRTRSRSSERDRHQTPPPVSGSNIHHVGSFLSQLDELRPSNSSSTSSKPRESAREESSRKLANVRDMMQAGTIQGTPLSFATQETIAPIVQHPGIPVQPAKDERRVARDNEEHGRNLKQKMIAVMMEMEKMIVDYGGNVPRHAILEMYQSFGLNPEDGDREINMLLQDMRKIKSGENKATLNDSISQLGIPLNQPQYQQSQSYGIPQYSAPAPAPIAPPTQYGIAPSGPSAYAQAFHVTPTASASAPAPAPIAPAPTTSSSTQQPFYKNPPTSMASEPVVDKDNKSVTSSADDDDDYSDVYQVLGGTKKKGLIPGQKMALKRTILPSGARVEEEKPAAVTSSPSLSIISEPVTPTKQPAPAPVTQPPALETSFGIPAPVSITTAPPPQQTYATTQMYQTLQQQQPQTTYQYQQPPPQQQYQMYQQPPPMVQQQQQPVQYGIPNTFQQPPPMQQYGAYQQQQMQMNPQSMYQPPPQIQQWPPTAQVPQQQVYYQQPPPNAQQYGISAPNPANPNQQYYTYQR